MSLRSSLRSAVYQAEKLSQRLRFVSLPAPTDGWPALIGISFPKSGTHLLDQILLGFSKVAPFSRRLHSFFAGYEGETGRKRSLKETTAWVDSLRPLDIASAHLFAWPEVVERLATPAYLSYFIFRDPRDVAVSHVFYVTEMEKRHVHHEYYAALPDFNARLSASILGRPDAGVEFPDIAARFAPYLGWLDHPAVMPIHFEDLVNDRPAALDRIVDHFLARVPLAVPRSRIHEVLESSINPAKSPTFRSGRTGEWKQHFTPQHRAMFKEAAGDLLIRLGYEKDNDW
ncbi:MAG TPA: sulfotransferase domain-containing protein [Anaerolineales bacterium]